MAMRECPLCPQGRPARAGLFIRDSGYYLQWPAPPWASDSASHAGVWRSVAEDIDEQNLTVGAEAGAGEFRLAGNVHGELERHAIARKTNEPIYVGKARRKRMRIIVAARIIFTEENSAARRYAHVVRRVEHCA